MLCFDSFQSDLSSPSSAGSATAQIRPPAFPFVTIDCEISNSTRRATLRARLHTWFDGDDPTPSFANLAIYLQKQTKIIVLVCGEAAIRLNLYTIAVRFGRLAVRPYLERALYIKTVKATCLLICASLKEVSERGIPSSRLATCKPANVASANWQVFCSSIQKAMVRTQTRFLFSLTCRLPRKSTVSIEVLCHECE